MTDYTPQKSAQRLRQLQCTIYPLNTLEAPMFVAICSRYEGKWLLSRHRHRATWETQGGHIEAGETPLQAACRELYEESGATEATVIPLCDYNGFDAYGHAHGVVFLALIHRLEPLPESEMQDVRAFAELPSAEELTYPNVTPVFFEEAKSYFKEHPDLS